MPLQLLEALSGTQLRREYVQTSGGGVPWSVNEREPWYLAQRDRTRSHEIARDRTRSHASRANPWTLLACTCSSRRPPLPTGTWPTSARASHALSAPGMWCPRRICSAAGRFGRRWGALIASDCL
jgi:hypothetical protein